MNEDKCAQMHLDLVELLLAGLEDKKTIKEVLLKSNNLCQHNVSDIFVLKAAKKLGELKSIYDQGNMTEDEAKEEISNILVKLT